MTLTQKRSGVSVSKRQVYILTPTRGCMAKLTRRGGKKKYQWMQTRLSFQKQFSASGSPHADSLYIDVAQCLSLMNRKLVRQGQLFRIKGLRIWSDSDLTFRFKVATAPTNWVTRNAWVKSKALFDQMNAMALAEGTMAMKGKYHDYRVYLNSNHKSDTNVLPCDADGNVLSTTGAEWTYSQFHDSGSTTDEYDVKLLGQHDGTTSNYTCVGLIEAYRQSRVQAQAQDPVLPSDILTSPWMQLFGDDAQTAGVVEHLDAGYDNPPYPPNIYVGDGAGNDDGGFTVGTGTVGKSTSAPAGFTVPTFVAPCGLLRIEIDDTQNISGSDKIAHITFDVEILGPMDM